MRDKRLNITVETKDLSLINDLFQQTGNIKSGTSFTVADGITIELINTTRRRGFISSSEIIELALRFGPSVVSGVLSNWLWSKLNGKVNKIYVEQTTVEITQGNITRIISDRIEMK